MTVLFVKDMTLINNHYNGIRIRLYGCYVMKLLTGKMIIVTSCLNKMCCAAGSLHKS